MKFRSILACAALLAVGSLLPACSTTSNVPLVDPSASAATSSPTPSATPTPASLQKVLDDINKINAGAVADLNSTAGQRLLEVVGTGIVTVAADYSTGNSLGAGIAGGTALASALSDAAQLPTTSAQLAQLNTATAKATGDAANIAPMVAKIVKLANSKLAPSVKATAIIQKAASAVKTVAKVPSAVQQVTSIGT